MAQQLAHWPIHEGWLDEAGFLSSKQMHWLVDFAARKRCRLILSGDTKQHHSVERGDALRILENAGVVTQAMLSKIIRQQIEPLREAVQHLSEGRTAEGFDKLEVYGAVHEHADKAERLCTIVQMHLEARGRGESSLIVAPTHEECRAIADAVRARQKKEGSIGNEDRVITRLAKVNLTESQRRDAISFEVGQVVQFDRRAKGGFKVGEQWEVNLVDNVHKVTVSRDGQTKLLPLDQAGAFQVYRPEQMPLAAGDVVRMTKNGHGFRNNELCTVKEICNDSVTFADGRKLTDVGKLLHLDQGVCVTSHASQGKTVDNVIVSAPVAAFSQVNAAQFYVSMSRARQSMHLFTDSKAALREAVAKPSERVSALELMTSAMTNAIRAVRPPWMQHAQSQARQQRQRVGMER